MRHTKRRESFDGWFGNKDDDGRLEFDVEYSLGSILVRTIEWLIAGDDLEIQKSTKLCLKSVDQAHNHRITNDSIVVSLLVSEERSHCWCGTRYQINKISSLDRVIDKLVQYLIFDNIPIPVDSGYWRISINMTCGLLLIENFTCFSTTSIFRLWENSIFWEEKYTIAHSDSCIFIDTITIRKLKVTHLVYISRNWLNQIILVLTKEKEPTLIDISSRFVFELPF